MWRLRLLLLPGAAVGELAVLLFCWILAVFSPRIAKEIMDAATATFPPLSWYIGE